MRLRPHQLYTNDSTAASEARLIHVLYMCIRCIMLRNYIKLLKFRCMHARIDRDTRFNLSKVINVHIILSSFIYFCIISLDPLYSIYGITLHVQMLYLSKLSARMVMLMYNVTHTHTHTELIVWKW